MTRAASNRHVSLQSVAVIVIAALIVGSCFRPEWFYRDRSSGGRRSDTSTESSPYSAGEVTSLDLDARTDPRPLVEGVRHESAPNVMIVSGTVTLDGIPLPDLLVEISSPDHLVELHSFTDRDGRFVASTDLQPKFEGKELNVALAPILREVDELPAGTELGRVLSSIADPNRPFTLKAESRHQEITIDLESSRKIVVPTRVPVSGVAIFRLPEFFLPFTELTLVPLSANERVFSCKTNATGFFEFDESPAGVPPGVYRLGVSPLWSSAYEKELAKQQIRIPAWWQNPYSSGITIRIPPKGTTTTQFLLSPDYPMFVDSELSWRNLEVVVDRVSNSSDRDDIILAISNVLSSTLADLLPGQNLSIRAVPIANDTAAEKIVVSEFLPGGISANAAVNRVFDLLHDVPENDGRAERFERIVTESLAMQPDALVLITGSPEGGLRALDIQTRFPGTKVFVLNANATDVAQIPESTWHVELPRISGGTYYSLLDSGRGVDLSLLSQFTWGQKRIVSRPTTAPAVTWDSGHVPIAFAAGTVTLDGAPLANAALHFLPIAENDALEWQAEFLSIEARTTAFARSSNDGYFIVDDRAVDFGVRPGRYNVGITQAEDSVPALPTGLSNPVTSGITVTIPAQGSNELRISVRSEVDAIGGA